MKLQLMSAALLALAACSPATPTTCKLTDATTCTNGTVCERVTGEGNPHCFQPVQLSGTVKVFGGTTAIANAEIVAVDSKGIPVGPMVKSDSDGTWTMRVVADRSNLETGAPIFRTVSLRVAAQDHLAFPSPIRTSQPIDMSGATAASKDKPWIFTSALTGVTLTALGDSEKGNKGVSGTIELGSADGALVVLEGSTRSYSTVPDSTGAYHFMNVVPSKYTVAAYAKGVGYNRPEVTTVAGTESTGVALTKDSAAMTATLTGSVQLVPGANGAGTSVVLFPASTFIEALGRGETVPGLRAPESGTPNVTGQYTISGVPNGSYVAVVATENDGNVRDPDPAIAMAQIARVVVTAGTADNNPVFKAVGAVEILSPGAGAEVEAVAGTPTFTWKPFDGATVYELSVFTQQGTLTWGRLGILGTSQAYEGPMLKPGFVYQWRVQARGALLKPVSLTEELKGLFSVK